MKVIFSVLLLALFCVAPRAEESAINYTSFGVSSASALTIKMMEPRNIIIATKTGKVTISLADGKVTLDDGVVADDAAMSFWNAVALMGAQCRQ